MGDPDELSRGADAFAISREAPILYIVDAGLNVTFASIGGIGTMSPELVLTVRAAVTSLRNGAVAPALFEGRLVRAERLSATGGGECYVVFLERIAARD